MKMVALATGPADLRDQQWLDGRIAAARDGIEAVIEIALNWTDGRGVGRLHPGVAPADYVREHIGIVGRAAIVPLLTESNWSNRQIAAIAGVSEGTVRTTAQEYAVERPDETLGRDGKLRPRPVVVPTAEPVETPEEEASPIDDALWDALLAAIDALAGLSGHDANEVAATVPERRRAATAKRLRKLGSYLGRIAWTLEGKATDE